MNKIYIFRRRQELENQKEELNHAYREVKAEEQELMNECSHDIVFQFHDNAPRKMLLEGTFYCPVCGFIQQISTKEEFKKSNIQDSRIIPLTNLSLVGNPETLEKIREEVWNKIEYYYNPNISIQELSNTMMNQLQEYQVDLNKRYIKK